MRQAAVMADIHDQIISWPDGYNTQVGERGLKLSGTLYVQRSARLNLACWKKLY